MFDILARLSESLKLSRGYFSFIISFSKLRVRFFYSQFCNENGQNVKRARSFIPHSHSGMYRTPFRRVHSAPMGRMQRMLRMKSNMADGETSAADSNALLPDLPKKKSRYTFGHNELLLISLYQKYEAFLSDVSFKKKVIY